MGINRISDAFLKAHAEDDISYLTSKNEFNKKGMLSSNDISFFRSKIKTPTFVQDIVDKTGLKAENILDMLDERENFIELDLKPEIAGQTKQASTNKINENINKGEDWLIKNSENYDTPDQLKKGFKRVFGKEHPFLQKTLRTVHGMPKLNPLFFEGKDKVYQSHGKPAFVYGNPEMKNLFEASLYNFNPAVRTEVLNELNDILPKTKITENQKYDLRKKFKNSKVLSELGINEGLKGPVTRLLIKDLGENIIEDVNFIRYPRTQVINYINFLKDKVDPKYRKQFDLVNKALRQVSYKNYGGAKETFGVVENINFDHKVPKYLIDAGYADELEYIKLNPVGEGFNTKNKNIYFDRPIAKLARKYEATNIPEDKIKIVKEMNLLKDNFNKRNKNYLSNINIKEIDGKLNVSSSAEPLTSSDDLIKVLKTNLKKNPEFFNLANIEPTTKRALRAEIIPGLSSFAEDLGRGKIGGAALKGAGVLGTVIGAKDFAEMYDRGEPILDAAVEGGFGIPGPVQAYTRYKKLNLTDEEVLAKNRLQILQDFREGIYKPEYTTQVAKKLDPSYKDDPNKYLNFLEANEDNFQKTLNQSEERFQENVWQPFLEEKQNKRLPISEIPVIQKTKQAYEDFVPDENQPTNNAYEFNEGGRVGFSGGGVVKFARMITDLLNSLKKDLSFSSHLEKLYGSEAAKKQILSPYRIPEGTNKSQQSDILTRIDEIKQNLPKEYSGLINTLDDIEKNVNNYNYIDASKKGTVLLDNLPDSFNFEKLPQNLFPMEDPLNDAFILFDPKREKMVGRYTMRYNIDPETNKGIIQTYDTYDPVSKKFLEEKDWKLIGVDAREESGVITKEGLN
jgi:hypothetical protein